jgi:hypothetical protein
MSIPEESRSHEEWRLAEYLIARVCARAAGCGDDECTKNYPRDVYFLGNLRPRPENSTAENAQLHELQRKLAPMAFGAEFKLQIPISGNEVSVKVTWACYYRVFPSLNQQREHQVHRTTTENAGDDGSPADEFGPDPSRSSSNGESANIDQEATLDVSSDSHTTDEAIVPDEPPPVDRKRSRRAHDSLFIRFRKIVCCASGTIKVIPASSGEWSLGCNNLQNALDQELARARAVAREDPERLRITNSPSKQIQVPDDALRSEGDFRAFLVSMNTEIEQPWRWEVRGEIRLTGSGVGVERVLSVQLLNASFGDAGGCNIEPFLFDAEARFSFGACRISPFDLTLAPRGFRYDRELWGHGFNCVVERTSTTEQSFKTTFAPIFRQMRYVTRLAPPAPFAELSRNPSPLLDEIMRAMESDLSSWHQVRRSYMEQHSDWTSRFEEEFGRDREHFESEIARFRRGVELIRSNADVALAFRLTNETFRRMGENVRPEKRKTGWRLFQIVFLITQIDAIESLVQRGPSDEERRTVDIIYFPTGGGKTEAYLATLVFHSFFDRLRGKAAGVTAWTRFPLRLLTLQQTQRLVDAMGMAELVRLEQRDSRLNGNNVDGFSVGYFVGAEATPNEIVDPDKVRFPKPEQNVLWSVALDPEARQRWKRIVRCPSCKSSTVRVEFDAVRVRVLHKCTVPNCAFPNGEIPVFVIDNEIYRNLPTIVVGTIDKLAGLGNQRKMAQLFGQVDGRCVVHGYYKIQCCQKDCGNKKRLKRGIANGLSGPTLFVQDELHLLKEGLGTFDAHYETFTQMLLRRFGQNEPLKIIASSATIEAFARQIANLYGRTGSESRVFPGPGPTLQRSFYAETLEYPQRLYVGVIPHNKTIFNMMLELIEYYTREVQALRRLPEGESNPYGGIAVPNSTAWFELLDSYTTSITYFLVGKLLNSIKTDLVGHVNPSLQRDGLSPLEIHELTGSTSTDEVTRILERLEAVSGPESCPDAVLATSMISHGVDVDRFNAMFFYGMPRQNAEYIQASSRVGRSHVGIVFSCLHPVRERDRSHFEYFTKYHEFLGQMVEPVAINRWAKFSINRTLPGLFMAILLQVMANGPDSLNPNQYYLLDFLKKKFSDGSLSADDFVPMLKEAYLVQNPNSVAERVFSDEIVSRVGRFIDEVLGAGAGEKFVSNVLIPSPMRSLRDVDEAIEIELDNTGSQWASPRTNGLVDR